MTTEELEWALKSGCPVIFHDPAVISGETGTKYSRVLEIIRYWNPRGRRIDTAAVIADPNGKSTVRCLAANLELAIKKKN